MPRNVSGTYSLPLPPVVANTVIQSAWANSTTDDIAQGITDSLDRNGRGGMIAPFRLVDGSVLQPAFAFASETGTGLYKESPGVMGVSVMGVKVASWSGAAYSVLTDLGIAGNLNLTGDMVLAGDIVGTIHVTGGIAVDGGITSFDDVSSVQNFDGAAGFFATNLSAGTHSYAIYRATNNNSKSVGLAAVGNANLDFPANSDTGVLFSDHTQGLSLVSTAAAGIIRFFTNGFTERMRIDAAGRLGIGMSPVGGALVDVKGLFRTFNSVGVTEGVRILNSSQANGITLQVNESSNLGVLSSDTAAMTFWCAGSERMRIDTSGNVGIGATSSGARLHISAANAQGGITVFNVGASTSTPLALTNGADADFHVIITGVGAATKQVNVGPSNGATNAPMVLQTVGVERMRFGTDGLVVINRPSGAVLSDGRLQVHDAAKVPNIAFVKNSVQGWYVGGDKSGATNRFDISANGGALLSIDPSVGKVGFGNSNFNEFFNVGAFGDGQFKQMAVYGPYGNTSLGNFYAGMANGNGGGVVELNGHTSGTTLASWQMIHHSDIYNQDLVFRYSSGGGTRSSFVYSERMRISSTMGVSVTNAGGSFYLATDPGPNVAQIPYGAIVYGALSGPLGAAASGLGTIALGAGSTLSWGGYTGGSTTTINYGVWRNIGAQSVSPAVGLWMRVA